MTQRIILQQLMPSLKSMVDLPTLNLYLVSRQIINLDQVKKLTESETCNKCEIILKLVEVLCTNSNPAQLLLSILEEIEENGDGSAATNELITTLKESIANPPPSSFGGTPRENPNGQGVHRRNNQRRRGRSRGTPSGYESSQSLESISEARDADPFLERAQSDMELHHGPREFHARMEEGLHERGLVMISNPNLPPPKFLAHQSQLVFSQAPACVVSMHASPIAEEAVTISRPVQCTGHAEGSPVTECRRCMEAASSTFALVEATNQITTHFAQFVLKTKWLVEERSDLQDVILFFLQKYSLNVPGGSIFPDIARIKQSANFHDLMDKLGPYISWFEYGPLALLCQTFGGVDGEALVADYESKLKEYLGNCVHECSLILQDHPPQDYAMFSVKLAWDWNETNYVRVSNFKRTLASILRSNPQSFFLKEISRGCVLLTFLAPTEMGNQLERMAAEFPQALAVHDVMGIIVDNRKTVIQETLLKFSWTGESHIRLDESSNATSAATPANNSTTLGSTTFKNFPHYFQTQDDFESSFMSQSETSQVWEFASGSEDYPQTSLSAGESQKSSSSYSTNKDSQNEFDCARAFPVNTLDRSPQGSGYIFAGTNPRQMQSTPFDHTDPAHRSPNASYELSCNRSRNDDSASFEASASLEAPSSVREGTLTSEGPTSRSRTTTFPIASVSNQLSERIFADKLCQSLTRCQQFHPKWSDGEEDENGQHQGDLPQTDQKLTAIQQSDQNNLAASVGSPYILTKISQLESSSVAATQFQHVSPSQAPKSVPNIATAENQLPDPNRVEATIKSNGEVSVQSLCCQAESIPGGAPPVVGHQAGILPQVSLHRWALTHASSINSLHSEPAKRNSVDSGYSGSDSKRSSYGHSNCSTPESASPRESFSSNQRSPGVRPQPLFVTHRDRAISPLAAYQEEICSSVPAATSGVSSSRTASTGAIFTEQKSKHTYKNMSISPLRNADTDLPQNSESQPRSHLGEDDKETVQQMISAGNISQTKRLTRRQLEFRKKYSQHSSKLKKECATDPPNLVISSTPLPSNGITNTGVNVGESATVFGLHASNSPSNSKADGVQSTAGSSSPPKVKLLCRPFQSRRKSCEITADESAETMTTADQDNKEEGSGQEGEFLVEATKLNCDTSKQESPAEKGEHGTPSPECTHESKVDKRKSATPRSFGAGIMLATLGEDEATGVYPILGSQSSTDATLYDSQSTLGSASLDRSCFSTMEQSEARAESVGLYTTVTLKSNASCRSTASGRSDAGYQTDQETPTPVPTPVLCVSRFLPGHANLKSAESKQQELFDIAERKGTPTVRRKTSENPFPDGGYGTYRSDAAQHQ